MREFLDRHQLPAEFEQLARNYYDPLADWLQTHKQTNEPFLLGVNGAQGTGKSTLADYLRYRCEGAFGWCVAVLSIDDFYLTAEQRQILAEEVHPLLATRGVPGTHDTQMLASCLTSLRQHGEVALPRFDKSTDDRRPQDEWPSVLAPVDLIILEGWCVGTETQTTEQLTEPANALEEIEDPKRVWRNYANDQLGQHYAPIFAALDALVYLQAPNFEAIYRWRVEQEEKLGAKRLMDDTQIARFIQFYERLTRTNFKVMPDKASVVYVLDEMHHIREAVYRGEGPASRP